MLSRLVVLTPFLLSITIAPSRGQQPTVRLVQDLETTKKPASFIQGKLLSTGQRNVVAVRTPATGYELFSFGPNGEKPAIVRDLMLGPASSNPELLVLFQGKVLFLATTDRNGRELWETDGTTKGTKQLFEVATGKAGSQIRDLVVAGNTLYFSAVDTKFGRELWSWNGQQLRLVVDLRKGTSGSGVEGLRHVHGQLWFRADSGNGAGVELYASDGTAAGTRMVRDISAGSMHSAPREFLAVANRRVAFFATTPQDGVELWVTDGTSNGTSQVTKGIDSAQRPRSLGNRIVFSRVVGKVSETWSSDGTAKGTIRVAKHPFLPSVQHAGLQLYQAGGPDLWATDGTPSGTRLIAANRTALGTTQGRLVITNYTQVATFDLTTNAETRLIRSFAWNAHGNGVGGRLWLDTGSGHALVTDGTAAASKIVQLISASTTLDSHPGAFARIGGHVFLRAERKIDGRAFFRVDPQKLSITRRQTPVPYLNEKLVPFAGHVWYARTVTGRGAELAAFEPGTLLPRFFHDLNPGAQSSLPRGMTPAGRTMYFFAKAKGVDYVWSTDGGKSLPTPVLWLGANLYQTQTIIAWGEHAVIHDRNSSRNRVWVNDGTNTGSRLVLSDFVIQVGATRPGDFLMAANAGDFARTRILVSDGTVKGTRRLYTSTSDGNPQLVAATTLGDRYLVGTDDGLHVTDGTVAGTKSLYRGQPVSHVARLDPKNAVFVVAQLSTTSALWITDGAKTRRIATIPKRVEWMSTHGARWVTMIAGKRLYLSDGQRLLDMKIEVARRYLDSAPFALVRDRLFFPGKSTQFGTEPHVVTGLGATASTAGEGCGTGSRVLRLESAAPRVGSTTVVELDRGRLAAGILALGVHTPHSRPGPAGCAVHLDLKQPILTKGIALVRGKHSESVTLPNSNALRGLEVAWQAFSLSVRFEASNALLWHID